MDDFEANGRVVTIQSDAYSLRPTLDLSEHGEHIRGIEVKDENGEWVAQFEGCSIEEAVESMRVGYFPRPRCGGWRAHAKG